jgi:signal transduction histidine kinase
MGERRDPADTWSPSGAESLRLPDVTTAAGVIVHDAEGRIVSATDRALELLGVTLNQLRGEIARMPVWTFTDAEDRAIEPGDLAPFAVVRTGRPVPGGLVGVDDGSPRGRRWLRIDSQVVRDDIGRADLILTTLHDATHERRAQQTNNAAAAIASRAVEREPGDFDGLAGDVMPILGESCDAARVVCIQLDRAMGRARLTHQWSRNGVEWPRADGGAPIDLLTLLMRHLSRGRPVSIPDGRVFVQSPVVRERLGEWGVRSAVNAPIMVAGRLEGFVAVTWDRPMKAPREVRDLLMLAGNVLAAACATVGVAEERTDLRRRLAEQTAAWARRAELYVDVTPDLSLEIDEEDRLVDVAFPGTYDSEVLRSIQGHNVLDVFAGSRRERLAEVLRAVRAGSPIEVFEFDWDAPGGTRCFEARFTAGQDGRIVSVVREVTGAGDRVLQQQSQSLAMANEELTRLVHERDQFLASVSHELRTPLNAILGLTEMLLDGRDERLSITQSSTLRTIESSGRHLLELINDLLDLSRLRAQVVALDLREVSVDEPSRLAFDLIRPRALTRGVHVELDIGAGAVKIRADERRLRQVLINLMDNAVSFTEPGGHAGLRVSRPDDDHVAFTVWDTGLGIAAGDQSRIFEPFTQLSSRRDTRRTSSGLGLSVVERLVKLHGGTIDLESAPGRGSRFIVVLPLAGPDGLEATDGSNGFGGRG